MLFGRSKSFLRRCDRSGLVDKHGAEYGFVRNLCGSRTIFAVQAGRWNRDMRVQRELAPLDSYFGLLGKCCVADTLATFRVACPSQNVGAECPCVCGTRVGHFFEFGRRRNTQEAQFICESLDRPSTRVGRLRLPE